MTEDLIEKKKQTKQAIEKLCPALIPANPDVYIWFN